MEVGINLPFFPHHYISADAQSNKRKNTEKIRYFKQIATGMLKVSISFLAI